MADLTDEPYFIIFLSGLAEIPGTLAAWYTMERYGRRSTMIGGLLLAGFWSAATAFIPDGNCLPLECLIFYQMTRVSLEL